MIKGIIFDMDGVLVDTEEQHYNAWYETFKTVHHHLSPSEYNDKCRAQGRFNAITNILDHPSEALIDKLSTEKERQYIKAIMASTITMFEDAVSLLEYAKAIDLVTTIASSSSNADFVIEQTQYVDFFLIL